MDRLSPRTADAHEAIAVRLGLTDDDRAARIPSGTMPIYKNRNGWAHDRNRPTKEFERVRGTDDVEALFVHKNANHCGVQIADLIARPIAMHVLRPEQKNRAYADIESKLRRSPDGKVEGWGLKCFP